MKSFCERVISMFRLVKASDASCVMTDCFEEFATGILNFHISGSIRRKKALEIGKCSIV